MPNKWGEFTAEDGLNILNQARGFKRDRLYEEDLQHRHQLRDEQARRDAERLRMQTETHGQNLQLGKQQMDMNTQTMGYRENQDGRAEELHALDAKLKRVNIDAANYSVAQKRKLAAKVDAIEVRANEMYKQGSETGSFEFLHSPKNAIDAAAGKLVFDNLKHNEDAGSSYANLHTKRVATNYANNVAPNIDRALNALKSGDKEGFSSATKTAMHYADLPYRLEPADDGFKMMIRSDENDGKFVETGAVLSKEEAAQYLAQVKMGEQAGEDGVPFNPAYNNMAAQAREATAQINSANLLDTSKWKPVRKDGKTMYAVPQSPLNDYTAETRYILVDKDGNTAAGFDFGNPMTTAQLMESGVTAMKGLSKKRTPMTEEQVSKEIRALCTTKDGMGNETYDPNRAAVLSRVGGSGGDIHQANQQYEKLVSDGVNRHVRTGAKPEQVMPLVQQQVAEMMLKPAQKGAKGLAKSGPSKKTDGKQGSTSYKGFIDKKETRRPALPPKGLIAPPNENLAQFNDASLQMASSHDSQNSYGLRADGTEKGTGYFGELPMQDGSGKVATEISIGVNIDGRDVEIPTLVPTLSEEEKSYLLNGGEPTEAIVTKAVEYARMRMSKGLSPFADNAPRQVSQR